MTPTTSGDFYAEDLAAQPLSAHQIALLQAVAAGQSATAWKLPTLSVLLRAGLICRGSRVLGQPWELTRAGRAYLAAQGGAR